MMALDTGVRPARGDASVPRPPGLPSAAGETGTPRPAAGTRLPVVVLTTFFPNPRDPNRTPFLRHLVRALGQFRISHL